MSNQWNNGTGVPGYYQPPQQPQQAHSADIGFGAGQTAPDNHMAYSVQISSPGTTANTGYQAPNGGFAQIQASPGQGFAPSGPSAYQPPATQPGYVSAQSTYGSPGPIGYQPPQNPQYPGQGAQGYVPAGGFGTKPRQPQDGTMRIQPVGVLPPPAQGAPQTAPNFHAPTGPIITKPRQPQDGMRIQPVGVLPPPAQAAPQPSAPSSGYGNNGMMHIQPIGVLPPPAQSAPHYIAPQPNVPQYPPAQAYPQGAYAPANQQPAFYQPPQVMPNPFTAPSTHNIAVNDMNNMLRSLQLGVEKNMGHPHPHPLSFRTRVNAKCDVCKGYIGSSSPHCCAQCNFDICASCFNAQIQRFSPHHHALTVGHGTAFRCDVCLESHSNTRVPRYSCRACDYDCCELCWNLYMKNRRGLPHSHSLHSAKGPKALIPWNCDICRTPGSPGHRNYLCEECDFDVCSACYQKSTNASSCQTHKHPLSLTTRPSTASCDVCKGKLPNNMSFYCSTCDYDVCLTCHIQEKLLIMHPHSLKVKATAAPSASGVTFVCDVCKTNQYTARTHCCEACDFDCCEPCYQRIAFGNNPTVKAFGDTMPGYN